MSINAASYSLNHGKAFRGMVADGELANIISKLNTDTVTIGYGKAVVRDGDNAVKLPVGGSVGGSVAVNFVGVAVRELNRSYLDSATFGAVVAKDLSVLTAGVIWVTALEAVVSGDPAFFRVGSTGTGDFSKSEGEAETLSVAIPNAKFVSSGAAGTLVKLSIVVGG
jgi:hypothetical protein